jgi:hypothetical protein
VDAQLYPVPHIKMPRLMLRIPVAAMILLRVASLCAQASNAEVPEANPARPTVATPATLTPVGYLQFENGALYADSSPEVSQQFSLNQVTKLTVLPRLEFLGLFDPYVYSRGTVVNGLPGSQPGSIAGGVQAVVFPGKGAKPTIGLSYIHTFYLGRAPDLDIGTSNQSLLFLWSEDLAGFHFDLNGIFGEETQDKLRRAQYGQTLSVSHPVGPFVLAGELWHFTQPLLNGNAVGNLWALSYAARKNLVFDAGFDHGFTSSSTQWEGFAGFTYLLPHRLWKARDRADGKASSGH